MANIEACLLYLWTGIAWADRTADPLEHLKIRDVVAHKHDLVVVKAVLSLELLIDG